MKETWWQIKELLRLLRAHNRVLMWGIAALVAADCLSLAPPWFVKKAIDALPELSSPRPILPYAVAIVVVVLFQAALRFHWRRSIFGASREVESILREKLFQRLLRLDRSFFLKSSTGDLMSRLTNDLVAVQEFAAYFVPLLIDAILMVVGGVILMVLMDPVLTAFSLIPLPLLALCFLYFGRKVRERSEQIQLRLSLLTQWIQETLAALTLIQAYTLEELRASQYRDATVHYMRDTLKLSMVRGLFYASLTFIVGTAALMVLWIGVHRVYSGSLSLGGFVAFNSYLLMLGWPMMSVGFTANLIQRARASMARLRQLLDQSPSIQDARWDGPRVPKGGDIRLEDVHFRYPGSPRWALRGVTLSIPRGKRVGITGPVGCGKTTLFLLIVRVLEPTRGRILLGDTPLSCIPLGCLRSMVAMVEQDPFLFSESVEENVRLGDLDVEPSEMEEAISASGLDLEAKTLPNGLETIVGERGVMVSGGQRQRVAIARALLRRPSILLLDDAFSHMDAQTETQVMGRILSRVGDGVTLVFSSNRLSTLMKADWVAVLRDGRISEQGPPEELVGRGGYLEGMYLEQMWMNGSASK